MRKYGEIETKISEVGLPGYISILFTECFAKYQILIGENNMKRALLLALTIAAAIIFAACGGAPVDNKPANSTANSNAGTTKPAPVLPTRESLVAMETKGIEAWKNHDGKFWEGFLADNYVSYGPKGERMDKAQLIKMMTDDKCEVKSYSFSEEQMTPAGADAVILSYKLTSDYKCPGQPSFPNAWAASVYVRNGDAWKGAYHNEMPIMPTMDASAKPEAPKSAPKPAGDKKAEGDKKSADGKNPDSAAPDKAAAPAISDDSLIAAVKKGWEAWKNHDAKALGDVIARDFVLIDPMGKRYDNAGALKAWSEDKCEIKGVSFEDPKSAMVTKDMGIVTLKGIADGTCGGQPAGALFGSYVMVKDGDAWKAAMIFETPAM
jgi:ketosteroid isomerase-like protein